MGGCELSEAELDVGFICWILGPIRPAIETQWNTAELDALC